MMLKGRDKLYVEIIGEVLALAKSLQVLAPEPLGIIVLTRSLAPILKNPLWISVSSWDARGPGALVIGLEHLKTLHNWLFRGMEAYTIFTLIIDTG